MNFKEVSIQYMEYVKNRHKKEGFYNIYQDFKGKILPYFEKFNVNELKPIDIINWQNEILKKNFSNKYNRLLHSNLCNFLDFCCLNYELDVNVARKVGNFPLKIEEKKDDFYTLEEFNQFIKCVDNNIYKQFFYLMFYCGTRPSEAMALRFSDLDGNLLTIRHSITRHGSRELQTPKNQSSVRTIQIDNILLNDLLELKKGYIFRFGFKNYDYYVFGGLKPLSPTSIDRYKLNACRKANIRPITQHQFRHSHATFLLSKNVPINAISQRLGHSQISTTLDIYCHKDFKQEKKVNQLINSIRTNKFYSIYQDFKNKLVYILKHRFNMF